MLAVASRLAEVLVPGAPPAAPHGAQAQTAVVARHQNPGSLDARGLSRGLHDGNIAPGPASCQDFFGLYFCDKKWRSCIETARCISTAGIGRARRFLLAFLVGGTYYPCMKRALPAIVAVLGVDDYGPCEGSLGSASCPHCGAQGRYVVRFMCEDGSRRGAMRGCIQLFPRSPIARLTQAAYEHAGDARRSGTRLATWWADIIAAVGAFEKDRDLEALRFAVLRADGSRRTWLACKGWRRAAR